MKKIILLTTLLVAVSINAKEKQYIYGSVKEENIQNNIYFNGQKYIISLKTDSGVKYFIIKYFIRKADQKISVGDNLKIDVSDYNKNEFINGDEFVISLRDIEIL